MCIRDRTYIVTDNRGSTPNRYVCYEGQSSTLRRNLAGLASAIGHFIRETPWLNHNVRMAGSDERICSICVYGAAEAIHNVHQVTLQTRLRRPFWPNNEAFRVFVIDRIVRVDMHVCKNCVDLLTCSGRLRHVDLITLTV